ncbi:MAG: glycosyltransferase family 4 protein [Desulfobacteraceae bacterium]|nr:glycosyltransferase family 4 protein [Desulfobacteraceae bacterium]
MKILLFANTDWYLYNFRLSLSKAIRASGHSVVLVSPPGKYGELLKKEGFDWVPFQLKRRSLNPIAEFAVIMRLVQLYRRLKPDVVHHFTVKCVVYGSLAAKIAKIKKRVNAVAGMGLVFSSKKKSIRILRPFVIELFRFALSGKDSYLILQNPDDQKVFIDKKLIKAEKIHLIRGSGVDVNLFCPKPHNNQLDGKCVNFLLASRMLWDKGIGLFVEIAKSFKDDKCVNFYLAGEPDPGNPNSVPVEVLHKWNDEGLIQYLGHVPHMDKLLSKIDVLILPTTYGEGVPRILIEGAAYGLPLIATDVPGCKEIVIHGFNGILIKPGDLNRFKKTVDLLVRNPEKRLMMGQRSRQLTLEEFDEEIVIRKTMALYSKN